MENLPEQAWEDRPLQREAVAPSCGWVRQQDLVRNREVAKTGRDGGAQKWIKKPEEGDETEFWGNTDQNEKKTPLVWDKQFAWGKRVGLEQYKGQPGAREGQFD